MLVTKPHRLIGKFVSDSRGSFSTIFALSSPLIFGLMGMAVDMGRWELEHENVQRAADAAAMSAAAAYHATGSNAVAAQAQAIAAVYGYANGANDVTITTNSPPTSGANAGVAGAVEVIIAEPQPSFFARVVWNGTTSVSGRSVAQFAAFTGGPSAGGNKRSGDGDSGSTLPTTFAGGVPSGAGVCVLALDQTATSAIEVQGNSNVSAPYCPFYSDSTSVTSLDAFSVIGNAQLTALVVGTRGGIDGTSKIHTTKGIFPQQPYLIGDPYDSVTMSSYSICSYSNASYNGAANISPGVYCGGLDLRAQANLTLAPGVYVITGGPLKVNGQATMSGTGVTFVFSPSGTASINGGATISLTAPASGNFSGLIMFGDRAMPKGAAFTLNGGSSQTFVGAIDLPRAALTFTGNTTNSSTCLQIIADTVAFSGDSGVSASCSTAGVKLIQINSAQLLE